MIRSVAIVLFLLCALTLHAQERSRDTVPAVPAVSAAQPASQESLLPREEAQIFLPPFREYAAEFDTEGQRIAVRNMIMISMRMETLGEDFRRRLSEMSLIRSNFQLALPASARRSESGWEALGKLLLHMAAQYAASYARESLIDRRNDAIDYLHLPRGQGVIRTSAEAREMALGRGEMQAYEVWYDFYWSLKNRIPVPCGSMEPESR